MGKTELLRTFCHDKRRLFFVADLVSETTQLAAFSRAIGQQLLGLTSEMRNSASTFSPTGPAHHLHSPRRLIPRAVEREFSLPPAGVLRTTGNKIPRPHGMGD